MGILSCTLAIFSNIIGKYDFYDLKYIFNVSIFNSNYKWI